jgi:hypothetical protein
MIDQKQLENVEYFSYLGSMITGNERCVWEMKSRFLKEKAAFNKKPFHQQIVLNFLDETDKVLHLEYIFTWF